MTVATRAKTLTIRRVRNVMERRAPEVEEVEVTPGKRLIGYLPSDFDADKKIVVTVNGERIVGAAIATFVPRAGDVVTLAEVPGVTAAIVGAALGAVGLAVSTTTAAVVAVVVNVALAVALNFAVAALTPKPKTRRGTNALGTDARDAPLSSYFTQQNTVGAGVPIPMVYGRVRCFPHVIESFQQPRFDQLDGTAAGVTTIDPDGKSDQDAVYLHTRLAICHGPIESVSDVELDGNPVENFAGTQYEVVLGTNSQKALEGFGESKGAVNVQTTVTNSGGATTASTVEEVESFEVGLLFAGGLYDIDSNGNLQQRTVSVTVSYQRAAGGSFTPWKTFDVTGATRSPKPVWIRGPKLSREAYNVRVTRNTSDTVDVSIADEFRFETLNAVNEGGSVHPGLAQIGIRNLPGEQSRVWQRISCLVKGFNGIRQYTDPNTYTTGWTNNPAWCCAHFLTSIRHGMGKFYTYADIDLPSFIEWAEWCNEQVDDGKGGIRRRAEFNMLVDGQRNGQDLLGLFGQASGAAVVQVGGKWVAVIDRPEPYVQVFNESNISRGTLRVVNIPTSERATRITADFFNEDNDYTREPFIIEDDAVAPSDGHVDQQLQADGVTAPHQLAWQLERVLGQNRYSTRTCEFETGLEGLAVTVGSVFGLCHPGVGNAVATGQITWVAGDQRSFRIDDDVTLSPATSYTLVVVHGYDAAVEQKTLTNVTSSPTSTLEVSTDFDRTLRVGDRYSVVSSTMELYRCISITLGERLNRKIVGVLYDERAYPSAIRAMDDETTSTSVRAVRRIASPVRELQLGYRQAVSTLSDPNTTATGVVVTTNVIDVDWELPAQGFVDRFEVWWRPYLSSAWSRVGVTTGRHFEIRENVASGQTYEIAVVVVNPSGIAQSLTDANSGLVVTS